MDVLARKLVSEKSCGVDKIIEAVRPRPYLQNPPKKSLPSGKRALRPGFLGSGSVSIMDETKSCPPQKRAAATEATRTMAKWFCRGLCVPCSSGRRGHVSIQTDPLPAKYSPPRACRSEERRVGKEC